MAISAFGQAFAAARKSGVKTFEYGGKKFTTQTKEDVQKVAHTAARAAEANYNSVNKLTTPVGTSKGATADMRQKKFEARDDYETKAAAAWSAVPRTPKSTPWNR